jgi:hypothetical protein
LDPSAPWKKINRGDFAAAMMNPVKTKEMDLGPIRVPVMMNEKVASDLAKHLLRRGLARYDTEMEKVIRLGIEAARRKR